jgi:hypothetical protein
MSSKSPEFPDPVIRPAKPVDTFEALDMALDIVGGKRPELSTNDQFAVALDIVDAIAVLENARAERAARLRQGGTDTNRDS